jgi:hypothetical protein
MQIEDYFLFLSEDDIRIQGHRIGIDNVLFYFLEGYTPHSAGSAAQTGIPNQLGKLTDTPTMRWVFQCFQAIHLVVVAGRKQITNLTPQRQKILQFLGAACGRYYLLE